MPHRPPRKPRTPPPASTRPPRGAEELAAARAPLALPDFAAIPPVPAPANFVEDAREIGVEFDEGDVEKLGRYLAMLLASNDLLNLTAITDPAEAWRKHIFDSLTLLQALAELPEDGKVIDVGTGGGLPGIPLAICMPHIAFTLLEATGKKVAFLKSVAAALGLRNVTVVEGRAEVAGHDRGARRTSGREGGHREMYHAAVARAVGRLHTLAELTIPFVRIHGRALLIKGQQAAEELTEAERALHLLKCVHEGTIDTPTGRIVVLTKQSGTPKDYPRRDGEPKRAPLGAARDEKPEPSAADRPTGERPKARPANRGAGGPNRPGTGRAGASGPRPGRGGGRGRPGGGRRER
ncbi:MAG TPA: 16S rRNA (guanine(527)-N(7))-methyltransferase RsmG [Phycisphaerales bacterium]|nr:16S rRNA (guanine(527)-N(7))-methyltransferase RsmG [Phycisphaerales bacterium]